MNLMKPIRMRVRRDSPRVYVRTYTHARTSGRPPRIRPYAIYVYMRSRSITIHIISILSLAVTLGNL